MYQFTNLDGTPVDDWTNTFLNNHIKDNHEEFDQLIHQLEAYFHNWNKEVCSDCNTFQNSRSNEYHNWGQSQYREFAFSHGCCARCGRNTGYISSEWVDRRKEIMEHFHFDELHGFFDEKKFGCGIPRHLRSSTCLGYCCIRKKSNDILNWVFRACEIRGYT